LLGRIAHVDAALAKLDHAAQRAPRSAARLFRAFVLARLPARFDRTAQAVEELEALTAPNAQLPLIVMHDTYLALAQAYANVGRTQTPRARWLLGLPLATGAPVALATMFSVSPAAARATNRRRSSARWRARRLWLRLRRLLLRDRRSRRDRDRCGCSSVRSHAQAEVARANPAAVTHVIPTTRTGITPAGYRR
jgi:hypothetical protein